MGYLKLISVEKSPLPEEPDELRIILAKVRCINHLGIPENWGKVKHCIDTVYDIVTSKLMEGK